MAADYYQILNVTRQATGADVRAAYLRLAQESHPDRNGEDAAGGENRFKQIQRAYEVLSDPAQRAAYDRSPKDFQRAGKSPVHYRRGPSSARTQGPRVAPSANAYTRRDVPNAWLHRGKRSKASWLRTAIWLFLIAMCLWGCARVLLLVIPATLAGDDALPDPDSIQNRRTSEQVVQVGGPSTSNAVAQNSAPDSTVVQEEVSDETAEDSHSLDSARTDGGQPNEIHDGARIYQTDPELAFDGFSYPGQGGFDAALIDIEPTYPPIAATPPGELPSSVELPLSGEPLQDIRGSNRFDVRAGRPPPYLPATGSPASLPSWTSSGNWYNRDAYRYAGGDDGVSPSASATRSYRDTGYGNPRVNTSKTRPGPGGRPLASPILGSPYGGQPRQDAYGGGTRPYSNVRDRLSPRSMGAPRLPVGGDRRGSDVSGYYPSSPYSSGYPSSPSYPSAGSSMSSPYSPYSTDGGLYGPDR